MNVALTVVAGGLDKAAAGPVLCVKNWEKFQHYHERHPPWIRLYNSLLDDYEFTRLQDASKWLAVGLWLLASRNNNVIPDDATWIAQRISARSPVDLESLVSAGFLVRYPNASAALAAREQDARPEESRVEKRKKPDANASGRKRSGKPKTPRWNGGPACDIWMRHFDGTAPGGRIYSALAPLVKKYGEQEVLTNWDAYLAAAVKQGRGQYANPQDFAGRYGYYKEHGTRMPDRMDRNSVEAADRRLIANRMAIDPLDMNASETPF